MDILIKEKTIFATAPYISYGVYDDSFEKWKLSDEDENLQYYMIDDSYELVKGVTLPNDYVYGKYFYEDGEFVLNTEWKPYVSTEDRIVLLEEENTKLREEITSIWDDIAVSIESGVNEV